MILLAVQDKGNQVKPIRLFFPVTPLLLFCNQNVASHVPFGKPPPYSRAVQFARPEAARRCSHIYALRLCVPFTEFRCAPPVYMTDIERCP
jgi:hypothetical protein